jgi:hypothetical protein
MVKIKYIVLSFPLKSIYFVKLKVQFLNDFVNTGIDFWL